MLDLTNNVLLPLGTIAAMGSLAIYTGRKLQVIEELRSDIHELRKSIAEFSAYGTRIARIEGALGLRRPPAQWWDADKPGES